MEEGSLLGEILTRNGANDLQNSLIVNVFLLDDRCCEAPSTARIESLLALASLCVRLNAFLRRQTYPWVQGGDGPIFGIHVEDKLPHLRSQCRYGVVVADEWAMVHFMLEFSRQNKNDNVAIECWDEDDGQVILIEASYALPAWVDDAGPAACRHRCWIQRGRIVLIPPIPNTVHETLDTDFTRLQALAVLKTNDTLTCQRFASVDEAIQQRINSVFCHPLTHRSAVALPQAVAHLLAKRPELIPVIIAAWVDSVQTKNYTLQSSSSSSSSPPSSSSVSDLSATLNEGWQWTTQTFSRLMYAQCRTLTATAAHGDWRTDDDIPMRYQQSPSFCRIKAQAQNQATPHLKHAVALGARLVAGLEQLAALPPQSTPRKFSSAHIFTSEMEERTLGYWCNIDAATSSQSRGGWIREAWLAGPNASKYSLENVLQCPVYFPEVNNCAYPISFPGKSICQIIKSGLASSPPEPWGDTPYMPPTRDQVDLDDSWLLVSEETHFLQHKGGKSGTEADEMQQVLDGFQTFMSGESQAEGVAHEGSPETECDQEGVDIRPEAFLHLLRETLAAPSAEDLRKYLRNPLQSRDMYFSEEDYTLMEPASSDEDDDEEDKEMIAIMEQMDQELAATPSASLRFVNAIEGQPIDNQQLAEDAHVLSNLVKSVEASAGGPGPVSNILKEMGK